MVVFFFWSSLFYCFSYFYTFSLKLSEVNFTIVHCRPFSSTLQMGWLLLIFLIMSLWICLSLARVFVTLSESFLLSPSWLILLNNKHGYLEYCSWQSIFASSKELTRWVTNKIFLAQKFWPPLTLLSSSGNVCPSVLFLKDFYCCCCWGGWKKRCDYWKI